MAKPANVRNHTLTSRLQKATKELFALNELITTSEIDVSVLEEFRLATNHVRQTAWIVEAWLKQEEQNRDPYTLLPALNADRIRRATRICRELAQDLESAGTNTGSDIMRELYDVVQRLDKLLGRSFATS